TRLADALAPFPVALETLPPEIKDRWISADGSYRIEISPRENLDDNGALEAFVAAVRGAVESPATGAPIINLEAGDAVVTAFLQAFVSALVAISLLLWLLLRQLREVMLALAPLLLAGLFTCAITVAAGTPFNFANIIALPLLLGIGVDNALHMLHRYRTDLPAHGLILSTSTARAVWFSALTTSCGFGNLAVSPHLGTASMGVLLTIGVIVTLLCTLFVLPSMLVVMPLKRKTGESRPVS
ncbi:MAG: MMPL family transporter, partial [Gammaproteobacteria bacterium]|nr:MMPL family transporter [Gammaproteobacteria bacterium]